MSRTRNLILTVNFLGFFLAAVPLAGQVSAQTTTDRPATTTGSDTRTDNMGATNMGTTTRTADNDGFNPGWLGLLGLAGLAGLLPKKVQHVNTVTTHRPTDTTTR